MRRFFLTVGSALLVLLAGCSSNNNNNSTNANMGMNTQGGNHMVLPAGALATGTAATPVPGAQTVTATLSEYAVKLDQTKVAAGPVHLVIKNTGQRSHQLQVYSSGTVSGTGSGMPMGPGGMVQGAVGFLQLIPAGQTMALDVVLPAGNWEVACHLADSESGKAFDHYDKGMKTTLSVG